MASLSRREHRAFEQFVCSPFFNWKEHIVRLYKYFRWCLETGRSPDKEGAFAAAHPDRSFDDTSLRLANSDLLYLLERFWIYEEALADRGRNQIWLVSAYRKRNLTRHCQTALREARQHYQCQTQRDAEYFDDNYRIELEAFQLSASSKRYEAFNLQEIAHLLDQAYAARLLRLVCIALTHQALTQKPYRFSLLEAVQAHVEREGWLDIPAIGLYHYACRFLMDSKAEDSFTRFCEVLQKTSDQLPADEQRTLYLLAINFSIKKSNDTSQLGWYRTTLSLYRRALEHGLLLENGMLSRFAYNNIVGVAVRLGEIAWAEQFAERYRLLLERRYREATFHFNMARIAFARSDYDNALIYLQRADYKDFINGMNARILQMKIYCETREFDLLESHLDSMLHFIRRQRAVGYHRENYLKVVRYTRMLIRLRPGDTSAAAELRRQIESEPVLTEKEWLLSRLAP